MRRLPLGPYSALAARRATAVALLMQWVIVVTGATVRLTGSGLGCPNWPTCTETRPVPALERHALIEFVNRMTTTPTLLAALVAMWVCWRLAGPARRDLRLASGLVVAGIFLQAAIGAMTVVLELPPQIVAVHFLVSVGIIAVAAFAHVAARSEQPLQRSRAHSPARVVITPGMLATLLGVIDAGVLTTASGPHSGASGTGQEVDRFGRFDIAVTFHARGAYVFLVLVLAASWLRARRGEAIRDLGILLVLVAVQIALGEVQYRNGLPWQIVLAHVANAALLWLVAVRIAVAVTFATHTIQSQHDEAHRSHRDRPAAARSHAAR